ncbi:hypothetical protein GH733_005519 [Mirounga leonina]|nr:hypothetical protein GH733_005519 [Mirounga leonina]
MIHHHSHRPLTRVRGFSRVLFPAHSSPQGTRHRDACKVRARLHGRAGTPSHDPCTCLCAGLTLLRSPTPAAARMHHGSAGGELPGEVQSDISAVRRPGVPTPLDGQLPRVPARELDVGSKHLRRAGEGAAGQAEDSQEPSPGRCGGRGKENCVPLPPLVQHTISMGRFPLMLLGAASPFRLESWWALRKKPNKKKVEEVLEDEEEEYVV